MLHCWSIVVEVGVGSLVAYSLSEWGDLKPNRVLEMRTKWTDRETVAKVCQALAHTKSNERIGEARALSSSLLYRRIGDGSYGFAVPKLCGRIGDGSCGFSVPKLCERIGDSSYGHFRPYPDVIFSRECE